MMNVNKESPANINIGCKIMPWNIDISAILPCIKVANMVISATTIKSEVVNFCFMGYSRSMNVRIE